MKSPAKLRALVKAMKERSPAIGIAAWNVPKECPPPQSKVPRSVLGAKPALAQGYAVSDIVKCDYAGGGGTTVEIRQETGSRAQVRETIESYTDSEYYTRSELRGSLIFDDWTAAEEPGGNIYVYPKENPRIRTFIDIEVSGPDANSTAGYVSVKKAINVSSHYLRFLGQ